MSYKVKTDVFEGPFDLLVYLIEKAGVSVYDVNISEITDQYIAYVNSLKTFEPEAAAEFMVLAATLLQIKSRMLLPGSDTVKAEDEEDPRTELVRLIDEYRKYRGAADNIRTLMEDGSRCFTKPQEDISEYTGETVELVSVDMDRFIASFALFLDKKQREADVRRRYERVARDRMSMEAKAAQIKVMLKGNESLSFRELAGSEPDRFDLVLTFVTILELSRKGHINVEQDRVFGDIIVSLREDIPEDEQ